MICLENLLNNVKTVGIAGHVRPDGDCTGSCMGLYLYLKTHYPQLLVRVFLEEIPASFHFLKGTEEICHEGVDTQFDLFFTLDCADKNRLGFAAEMYEQAKKRVCIDHHISNDAFADENMIVPHASSTAELVYRVLPKEKITKEIAEALYLGIVHDTGVFQYSCTAPETMEAAAELLRKGINASEIIDKTFYEKTYGQNQILGKALLESFLILDGRCIVSSVSKDTMDFFGVKAKDLDGIVSQLRVTKGVEVAMFLYELEPGTYKVSLRSKESVDVSKIAQHFGGGGHKKAAGVSMRGTTTEVVTNLAGLIREQLDDAKREKER